MTRQMSFILKSVPPPPPSSGRVSGAPPSTPPPPGAIEGGMLDLSRWPLVHLASKPRTNDEDIARFLKNLEVVLRSRHGPFAVVHDFRGTKELSAKQRRSISDHLKQNTETYRLRCVGYAFVFDDPALRGALTAIFWMTPPPYQHRIFPDVRSADAWVTSRLSLL